MPKCPFTSAEMSWCRSVLVPKCLGSEVSGYHIKACAATMAGAWFVHRPVRPVRGLYGPPVGSCSFSGCNLPLFYCFLLTYIPYLWPISSTQCFYRPVRPEWPKHGSYTGPCGRCVVYTDLRSDSVIFLRSSWVQYPHFRAIPEISI